MVPFIIFWESENLRDGWGGEVRNKKFCFEMLSLRYLLSIHVELLSWQVAIQARQKRDSNWRYKFENIECTDNTQSQRTVKSPSVYNVNKNQGLSKEARYTLKLGNLMEEEELACEIRRK